MKDYPKYEFAYGVEDHRTGDIHSQRESRNGDSLNGEYSFHEADGTVRIVKYAVDKYSGFNTVVERFGQANVNEFKGHVTTSAWKTVGASTEYQYQY
ncbi:hypothetical protein NQ314_006251 [Rhamnusium bicolor]|uniref:Cuticle protein 7 n=1 Tax=Rhamnusium bicolor TaxID=1586634 RepID=A0AAV8Z8V9_9CUCU|nr:hypothetical protein NQ314_006251 [Rhamnusium bicolor]